MSGEIVFLIPLAGIALGALSVWAHHKQKMARIQAKSPQLSAEETHKIKALENRVQVLERIVTDGSYDTAREIEALRERPAIAAPPSDASNSEAISRNAQTPYDKEKVA